MRTGLEEEEQKPLPYPPPWPVPLFPRGLFLSFFPLLTLFSSFPDRPSILLASSRLASQSPSKRRRINSGASSNPPASAGGGGGQGGRGGSGVALPAHADDTTSSSSSSSGANASIPASSDASDAGEAEAEAEAEPPQQLPLDWTLKTGARFTAEASFAWTKNQKPADTSAGQWQQHCAPTDRGSACWTCPRILMRGGALLSHHRQ